MAIDTLHYHLPAIDKEAVLLVAIVLMAVFYGAETKPLALRVQRLPSCVFQRKYRCVKRGLFCIPCLDALGIEVYPATIAGYGKRGTLRNLLPVCIENIYADGTASSSPVEEYVGHEVSVGLGVDGHAVDVLRGLGDDEDRTPDASEVPIVSAALSKVHLSIGALFQYLHLKAVLLLFSEEYAVRDVDGVAGETALVGAVACLAAINLDLYLRKGSFKHQQYLSARPFLRQGEFCFVRAFLVGNALWRGLAIEPHTILEGAKPLQLPARGNTYLCPLPGLTAVGTFEVPFHHVVTTCPADILPLCGYISRLRHANHLAGRHNEYC